MNLQTARETYYTYSGKASDLARQLSFAGIAVIWLLRVGEKTGGVEYHQGLLWPLGAFVLALTFDLFQYVYATIAWARFHRKKELEWGAQSTQDFLAPPSINLPTNVFFYAKLAAAAFAYVCLVVHIGRALL